MSSPNEDFEYISPHEAADRLYSLSDDLEKHNVASETIEELRQISLRFSRHLNGLEVLHDRLQKVLKALAW